MHCEKEVTKLRATYQWQVLDKFGLADVYKGQEEATGEDFNVEEVEDGPRPFTALLDTGLKRTSTGSKVFAALKVHANLLQLTGWFASQYLCT